MYLYPPSKGPVDPMNQADRANWIRIRRMGTHFRIINNSCFLLFSDERLF